MSAFKHWYSQPAPAPFRAPEFYDNGPVVAIEKRGRTIVVFRQGEARLAVGETVVITPADFRLNFSNGVLPADGPGEVTWHNNGWFDLFEDIDGEYVHLDNVEYDLSDAIAAAEERLQ